MAIEKIYEVDSEEFETIEEAKAYALKHMIANRLDSMELLVITKTWGAPLKGYRGEWEDDLVEYETKREELLLEDL